MLGDGRFELDKEGLIVYVGLQGATSMAHARLYEAVDQDPVVIVGELTDNPGTSVLNAVEGVVEALEAAWVPAGCQFLLLGYDADEQTFSEVDVAGDGASEFVSILDILGQMPALYEAKDYTVLTRGTETDERFRKQAVMENGEGFDSLLRGGAKD
jgi:hypothetical protein